MEVQRLAVRYLYLRTYKSTVSKLKNNVGRNRSGLKRVVQEIEGKGEDSSAAILLESYRGMRGKRCTWRESVSRERWKTPIFQITEKMKKDSQKGEKFIRGYYLDDDSYKNTTLYMMNSSPPVCLVLLGPIMLCMLKDKALYITLFQKMTACIPGLKVYLQAYWADGKKALREA